MNDDDDVALQVQSKINELEQNLKVIKELNKNASEMLKTNDPNFHRDTKYDFLGETNKVIRLAKTFYSKHKRIIVARDSFDRNIIDKYFEIVLEELDDLNDIMEKLKPVYDQIIAAKSVTEEFRKRSEIFLGDMEDAFKYLTGQCEQFAVPVQLTNPVEIFAVTDSKVKSQFDEYQKVAKYCPVESPEYKEIFDGIKEIVENYYISDINSGFAKIQSYASIVGPSFMGKTQFAFSLARAFKVFYVNFSTVSNKQNIYKAFDEISSIFIRFLFKDCEMLKKMNHSLDSNRLARDSLKIELKTVGFLWYLIEYSMTYDPSKSEWFEYYLKPREFQYKPMSIYQYLTKLRQLVEENNNNFVPPIVFMDEYSSDESERIKLLRNLCRVLALPAILASTNANVNTLFKANVNSGARAGDGEIWVHAIRKLPSASLKAVICLSGWEEYADDDNNIDIVRLLQDLDITFTDSSKDSLLKLISFMKEQSKTCLQGVPLIAYRALKEKLIEQRETNLNVKEIWVHILASVRKKIILKKPHAFGKYGPYHSLAIMSNHQVITENEVDQLCDVAPTAEIVLETINNHFYFFGKPSDPEIIPFECGNEPSRTTASTGIERPIKLRLNDRFYLSCSHFKLFRENVLFCLSLWKDINSAYNARQFRRSIASIVCGYIYNILKKRQGQTFSHAMKNDSTTQECVVHWALCYSTMENVSELNQGAQFLQRFINHIQLDNSTIGIVKDFSIDPSQKINLFDSLFAFGKSCPKLVEFLSDIKIPYLLPPNNVTADIKDKLGGLCEFGTCSRLENGRGIDIEFDLLFKGELKKGYVECKYIDVDLSKSIVLKYIVRSKDSPFSMLVTFYMDESMKSAENWASDVVDQKDDKKVNDPSPLDTEKKAKKANLAEDELTGDELAKIEQEKKKIESLTAEQKQAIIDGFSVYSVFYLENKLNIVPLVERINPKGVFVIVQTNFGIPKR